MKKVYTIILSLVLFLLQISFLQAQTQYVNTLGSSTGWYSDDTRNGSGTDLVGLIKTLYGKPGQTPTAADDNAIGFQIYFGQYSDNTGSLVLTKQSTGGGYSKSQVSYVNLSGLANTNDLTGNDFYLSYKLLTNSANEYAVPKIGLKSTLWTSSQSGFTAIRSGESTWDIILVDWRGSQSGWATNTWFTNTITKSTKCFRIYRQANNSFFNTPPTPTAPETMFSIEDILAMNDPNNASHIAKTIGTTKYTWSEVIFGSGAVISSFQLGVGSSNQNSSTYIDWIQTTLLYSGNVIDFVEKPVHNITQNTLYYNIQAAINAANSGDEIHVASGTYVENNFGWTGLRIQDKSLKIVGAGSGSTKIQVKNLINGMQVLNSTSNPISFWLEGFTLEPDGATGPGFFIRFGETGGSFDGITMKDVIVSKAEGRNVLFESGGSYSNISIDNCKFIESKYWGFSINWPSVTVQNITITNSSFLRNGSNGDMNGYGLELINVNNLTISGCTFNRNRAGGLSIKRITNANISNSSWWRNGESATTPGTPNSTLAIYHRYGIKLWEDFGVSSNINITGCTISETFGSAINLGTYQSSHSIDGVTVTNCVFHLNDIDDGPGTNYQNLNIWESPSPDFGGPVSKVNFNKNSFITGSVSSNSINPANLSCNWWGTNDGSKVKIKAQGHFNDYTPWLNSGTDMSTDPGFQPDLSALWVDDDSPQLGSIGRIQEAINLVEGSTVNVLAGTYNESVTVNKSVKLTGAGCGNTIWRGNTIKDKSLLIVRNNTNPANIHIEISGFSFETEKNQTIRGDWSASYNEALTMDIHNNCFKHLNTRNPGTDFALYVDGAKQTSRGTQGAIRVYDNLFDVVTGGVLFEYCRAVDVINNTFNTTYEAVTFNYYDNTGTCGEQLVQGNIFNHIPVDWAFAINNWHGPGTYTILPSYFLNNVFTSSNFAYAIAFGVQQSQTQTLKYYVNNNSILSGTLLPWGSYSSQLSVDATCNWWGTTDPCVIKNRVSGLVNIAPYLTNGTDNEPGTPGFQPVPGSCNGNTNLVQNINTGKWFCGIQPAIDDATTLNGHTIEVYDGIYNENVTIKKSLTVRAINPPTNTALITGTVDITANNVTLENFKIDPPAFTASDAAIYINASNVIVKNNIITGVSGSVAGATLKAIHIYKGASPTISNIKIEKNVIENISNTALGGAVGITVQGFVDKVHILDNEFYNIASDAWGYGIDISPTDISESNTPTNANVLGNLFVDINKTYDPSQPGTPYPGVAVLIGKTNTYSQFADPSTYKINFNNFTGPTSVPAGVANSHASNSVNAEYNWWGHCNGPTVYPYTTIYGSASSGLVDYDPWFGNSLGGPALWLSSINAKRHGDERLSKWLSMDCGNREAVQNAPNRQPIYADGWVKFESDYGVNKYGFSDVMEVTRYGDITATDVENTIDKWHPSKEKKNLFVTFKTGSSVDAEAQPPVYYRDGRQCIFEAGGPLSGYNLYIVSGKLVFGMWNRFESKYTILENSSLYPLSANKTYYGYLNYDGTKFQAILSDGSTITPSPVISFAGISQDAEDKTGIGGAARTRYHDYSVGSTYSDEFDGLLGDIIIYSGEFTKAADVNSYLFARYGVPSGTSPRISTQDWIVISDIDKTGDNAISSAYPNPFSHKTSIGVNLTSEQFVNVELLDLMGRKVLNVFKGKLGEGIHDIEIDGTGLSSGIYFIKVAGEMFTQTTQVILNR